MGIKDLLRFMKPYVEPIHIKQYSGKRVGIDAYSWLHKGAYSCSMELCMDMEGDKKLQFLNYCMHRINLLHHHNISPVLVFDGGHLPCKAMTEEDRHKRRKSNMELAMVKFKEGNKNAASELFQRAVSITPSMAHQLIQILRTKNIEYVVAPYEADAQLAYLSSLEEAKGGISAVISEDSDLLAYGCSAVIFKMDRFGNGEEIRMDKVLDSVGRVPSFRHFDMELFTGMCVLAGCDFLSSVPGIGIAKSHSLVSKYRNLDRVLSVLKFEKGNQMPEDYLKSFKEAVAVFQHARIYDAGLKRLKHLKPLPQALLQSLDGELDYLGPDIPSSVATAIAEGKLDPCTMEAFNHFPSSGIHLKPKAFFPTPNVFSRTETFDVSSQQSCFTVISSQKTRTKRITVKKQEPGSKEGKPEVNLEKWNNMTESKALEKLAFPLNHELPNQFKTMPSEPLSMEVPNNNPFKKNNVIEDKPFEKLAFTLNHELPNQFKTMSAEPLSMVVPDNNPFKKRKPEEVHVDLESVTEQVSVLTEVEDSGVLSVTPESQKSVNSVATEKIVDKRKSFLSEKKMKKNNPGGKENKANSILNFFSRV